MQGAIRALWRALQDTSEEVASSNLSAFENQECGDARNFVAHRRRAVGVDVHLADLNFALILSGQLFDDWGNRAARAAPCCPKVH